MTTCGRPNQLRVKCWSAVKAALSVASLSFEGDLPASIFQLQPIEQDVAAWKAKAQVIVVFYTNAGHVTLNGEAYDADRMVTTGNPYKGLITELMNRGVQVELCGATAKARVGERRRTPRNQDQHGCHGQDDAAGSRRVRENLGIVKHA